MLDLAEIERIAASYPPDARFVSRRERERHFTRAQHLAWLFRFDPEAAAEALSANAGEGIQKECGIPERDGGSPHGIPHHLRESCRPHG